MGEALTAQLLFVVEGGQWLWPPVRKGYTRNVPALNVKLTTLSVQPLLSPLANQYVAMGFCNPSRVHTVTDYS